MTAAASILTMKQLSDQIREVNAGNGWGVNFDPLSNRDTVPGYLALLHSEVSEAALESLPAGMARELGDVIVRALDLMHLCTGGDLPEVFAELKLDEVSWPTPHDPRAIPAVAAREQIRLCIDAGLEVWRKEGTDLPPETGVPLALRGVARELARVVVYTSRCISALGFVPSEVVSRIVSDNRHRGFRHGNRRT